MAEPAHSSVFEKAIAVTPIGPNTYSARFDPACIFYRTAAVHFARKQSRAGPVALQLSFLRRTLAGPAVLTVQEVKTGTRISTIHVSLSQPRNNPGLSPGTTPAVQDKRDHERKLEVKVVGYITVSPPAYEVGPAVTGPWQASFSPPVVDFRVLAEKGGDGAWVRNQSPPPGLFAAGHAELFFPVSTLASAKTLEDQVKGVVEQWARFTPGGEPARWSNEAVLYLADMFPPALNRMGAMEIQRLKQIGAISAEAKAGPFWYPSVTLNVDLKTRLPAEGVEWLHSHVVTRMLRGSRADLEVVIHNEQGELVLTSTQVALVVDAARNLKGREASEKL
ncbi:thioesterase family protein [Aspergillus brunneoviolaceus CBS 621.78]|uniref:Uncharacterized protein n=1 Tax=Aspergillus brunneoviolaceus CBS 621.78 TaxID=1450534 RepID=A0ACD1GDS7_9EURO|nr:hypothetical protein BO95DRAFT_451869 [Aspergillus brunneoviolaceus CBS 621.78]RAH47406.1 hypothetical protein BO95DRAFT_451869 [Aspergillus brunneoviolaceus CBS 621.78]